MAPAFHTLASSLRLGRGQGMGVRGGEEREGRLTGVVWWLCGDDGSALVAVVVCAVPSAFPRSLLPSSSPFSRLVLAAGIWKEKNGVRVSGA